MGTLPDVLTITEAARVLRVSRSTAYELAERFLASDGREGLPVVRVGRLVRVPRRRLESFIGGPLSDLPPPAPEVEQVANAASDDGRRLRVVPTSDAEQNVLPFIS